MTISSDSIPTFAYAQSLSAALLDHQLVPINTEMAWLYLTVATVETFPEEVEVALQVRFGTGPWLLFTTPIFFGDVRLRALGFPAHGGGLGVRAPALAGLQVIAQGGP